MRFADLQSRINAASFEKFSNASACDPGRRAASAFGAGDIFGIFKNGYSQVGGMNGFEDTQPSFRCLTAQVPGIKHGDAVLIGGVNYTVRGPVETDGTGVTTLHLHEV